MSTFFNIYQELKDTGVMMHNHESDLYVPVTDATRAIIERYEFKDSVTTFRSTLIGGLWYDIPFAYLPYWEKHL